MSDSIDRQKVLNTLDFADKALEEERTVEKYKELLTECIKVLPPAKNDGDLISRQEILDRTVNRNSIWNTITDSEGNDLEDILNSIPSIENKGEWIPVNERPPEDKQEVIVSYENEDGEFVTKGIFDKKYGFNYPNVKAWMPLPEPYKKGGE